MTKIKTVSLCEATAKVADNMPNFSAWVRAKLLDEHERRSKVYRAQCPECGRVYQKTLKANENENALKPIFGCYGYKHLNECSHADYIYYDVKVA